MPGRELVHWKEQFTFLDSAEREFLALPVEVRSAFLEVFEQFTRHPTRQTKDLDVAPLRDRAGRWRLKVRGGHRGIYRLVHGRPEFEIFQTREEIYEKLRNYLLSRQK
ncbi:MAG: hypothetical protein WCA77_09525 [Thermoplasmata archaeon]